jgi:hypothetical protein
MLSEVQAGKKDKVTKLVKDSRLRIRLDEDLEAAIAEKIIAEHEVGMEVDRGQCLGVFRAVRS